MRRLRQLCRHLFLGGRRSQKPVVAVDDWAIGIYMGKSPVELIAPDHIRNPVLTAAHVSDVPAAFVADPFMLRAGGHWYMFFEVMNQSLQRGQIGSAVSPDGLTWRYLGVVLSESMHLSYPYVFEWMHEYYMVPETGRAHAVRLYRATDFPRRWTYCADLLRDGVFLDPTLFRWGSRWWLFCGTSEPQRFGTLRLYHAESLGGPWLEHPGSPVVTADSRRARPAGRAVVLGDRVIRYAQDCAVWYGLQVTAFEIVELDTVSYRERIAVPGPVLRGSGRGWNAFRMHHLDPHALPDGQWIACVDGATSRGA